MPSATDGKLTLREREVVDLLSQGSRPAAIAHKLVISHRTVEAHLAHARRKTGAATSAALAIMAARHEI